MRTKIAAAAAFALVLGAIEARAASPISSPAAAARQTASRCLSFSLAFSPRSGQRERVSLPGGVSTLSFGPSAMDVHVDKEILLAQNSSCPPLPPGGACCCADLADPFSCVPFVVGPCPPGTFPEICLTEPNRPECQPPPPPPEPTVRAVIEGVPSQPVQPSVFQFPSLCTGITADVPSALSLRLSCKDNDTGAIVANCNVQIAVRTTSNSGGHEHGPNETRPAGRFEPTSGNTGTEGVLLTTYTTPEVSGTMEVTITGTLADGTAVAPGTATIRVGRADLVSLPATGDGFEVGPSVGHSNNRATTSAMKAKLEEVPKSFRQSLLSREVSLGSIPTLVYISLNLPEGGLFDVDANEDGIIDNPWRPPHCGHRTGGDADLRVKNVLEEFRKDLLTAIKDQKLRTPVRGERPEDGQATHWHLTLN